MLVWSQQHSIISSLSLSFENLKKIHPKRSGATMERDKIFLNPSKYESYILSDFKFIVLWTVYKHSSNKIDTLKLMQGYTKEDIKEILKEKENIVLYENTFKKDQIVSNTKIMTPNNTINLNKKGEISELYLYWYFKNHEPKGRIQTRTVQRNNFLLEYFPKIQSYLNNVK